MGAERNGTDSYALKERKKERIFISQPQHDRYYMIYSEHSKQLQLLFLLRWHEPGGLMQIKAKKVFRKLSCILEFPYCECHLQSFNRPVIVT
jgi:hypothetical protein